MSCWDCGEEPKSKQWHQGLGGKQIQANSFGKREIGEIGGVCDLSRKGN